MLNIIQMLKKQKRLNKEIFKWLLVCITLISIVSCKPLATKTEASKPQEIVFASTMDIRDINPHLYLGEMAAQNMVFESLVINTKKGVKPYLAEIWKISPDGKVYDFYLRKDVFFSDGVKFDAYAVKLNFDAVLANASRHAWLEMVNQIQAVKVINDYQVQITLKNAYYPLLVELGLTRPFRFISPNDFIENTTKNGVKAYHGTGSWILAKHIKNQEALFVANPNYWGKKPSIQSVHWRVMPDPQTILLALEKGEVDLVFETDGLVLVDTDAYLTLGNSNKYSSLISEPIASRALVLNTTRPFLNDKNIRLALEYAINKRDIAEGIFDSTEVIADTLMAKTTPYCNINIATYAYNLTKSNKLLDEAGWQRNNKTGYREKEGKVLSLTLSFINKNAIEQTLSQAIQANLKKIGIQLIIQGEEKQLFLDRQRAGDFDIQYVVSWGTPYDPQSYISSFRVPAHADYHAQLGLPQKSQIDKWISSLLISVDDNQRQKLYTKVLSTLADEAVYIPLTYSRIKAIYNKVLHGVSFNPSQYEIPFEKMYF